MANLFDPSSIYQLLSTYGGMPQWAKDYPDSGARGNYTVDTNRIVSPELYRKGTVYNPQKKSTLAHEMSHAVQFQLFFETARKIQEKIRDNKKVSDQEKQFLDSAQKMYVENFGTVGLTDRKKQQKNRESLDAAISSMYKPSEGKKSNYDYYRTSPIELQAFGIGGMTEGGRQKQFYDRLPLHLDPSFATEFSILMDQFQKLPDDVKIRSKQKDDSIEKQRKIQQEAASLKFEDIFSDPFRPSIK